MQRKRNFSCGPVYIFVNRWLPTSVKKNKNNNNKHDDRQNAEYEGCLQHELITNGSHDL